MKIRAIRLREVGCFAEPVAIENLSGALDVLAGANEIGKSTLLRALKAAIFQKHRSDNKDIAELVPYSGGAPLVEVEFEAEDKLWRLRKQFVSERQALLTDAGTGKVVARGDEAHERALVLIAGGSGTAETSVAGFLLLNQGAALDPAAPPESARAMIGRVVEAEVRAATGGGRLRAIRTLASVDLAQRLTSHAPPRPTGVLKAALEQRNRLRHAYEAGRAAVALAAERQDRLACLGLERASLLDPQRMAAAEARVGAAGAAIEEARSAREQLARGLAELKACKAAQQSAMAAANAFAGAVGELSRLEVTAASDQAARVQAENALQSLEARRAQARSRHDQAKASIAATRAWLARREHTDRHSRIEARLAELKVQMADAQGADAEVRRLEILLLGSRVGAALVAKAETEAGAIASLEGRLDAGLPRLTFALEPGAKGRVLVNGRAVEDGAALSPSAPVQIEISGIGVITIDPRMSADREEDLADLAAHKSELAATLAGADVLTLAELQQALTARHGLERDRQRATDRLRLLAPRGVAALRQEADDIAANMPQLVDESPGPPPPRQDAEAAVREAERQSVVAERDAEAAVEAVARAREHLAALAATMDTRRRRLESLAHELPPAPARADRTAELAAVLSVAEASLNAAVRAQTAWAEKVPGEQAQARLVAEHAAMQSAVRTEATQRERIEREIAVLESELGRDREHGVLGSAESLASELQTAEAQAAGHALEAAALQALLAALDEVEQSGRERFLRPVLERVSPYLETVFPGARIDLDQGLSVSGIVRATRAEALADLSDGTREQIAVLVRLGFARLVADAGTPRPLILDDALVFSDDERILRVFKALERAAAVHQVIVLTCHERAFMPLQGTRLSLAPWRMT